MRIRFVLIGLVLTCAAPTVGGAASRVETDSLDLLRRAFVSGTYSDSLLPGIAEREVARRESARHASPARVADALEWLGRLRLVRVEPPAAESVLARAVAFRRREKRPDPVTLATTLGWYAEALRGRRQLAAAESTATQVLALIVGTPADSGRTAIRALATRGNALAERGRGNDAVRDLSRAVELAESLVPPDSMQLAQVVRYRARARTTAGDHREALADFRRAVTIQERALGDHPELATTLFMASSAAGATGEFVAARRFAERSLAIRERVFGPNHLVVGVSEGAVGLAMRDLGDSQGALAHYRRAVDIQRALPRPSPFELQVALNNLGAALLTVGDGAGARAYLEEASEVRVRAFGPRAAHSLWSGTRLAQSQLLTGDLAAATARLDSVFAAFDPARAQAQRLAIADALGVRGRVSWLAGRRAEALADLQRAWAIGDSALGSRSPLTVESRAWVAAAQAALGQTAEAWSSALALEAESREALRQSARSLAEHEALAFERVRNSGLDVLLALAADSLAGTATARAQLADAVVRARLLVLDQMAEERRSLPRTEPGLADAVRELESARDTLARVLVEALRRERAPDARAAQARARREAAERALAERSERFALDLRRSSAGFTDVVAALPTGSALVSVVRHEDPSLSLRVALPTDSVRRASRRYTALVQRAGAPSPERVDLGAAPPIEAVIERWLEACATPPPADRALAAAAQRRCDALGRRVRELVWDPLGRAIGPATRVFVVPDGALHAVNLMALPDARGTVLAERGPTVHRLTAERDLLPWARAQGHGLLALGGADFEHADPDSDGASAADPGLLALRAAADDSSSVHFAALPRTADEVNDVVASWRASNADDAVDVLVQTGAAASEGAFKRLAPGRRVLHVATHGFALGAPAAASRPGTRAVGAVTGAARTDTRPPHAAWLPGLALAGANRAIPGGGDDGYLTAEEVTSLDLEGSEWAVLSACETGLADLASIEPVQGLPRAFRRAGTRTVVMSLWAVDDESTRAWMTRLYHARLALGLDTAESVRTACRDVLRDRRARGLDTHPFHWAAFVASGDWR